MVRVDQSKLGLMISIDFNFSVLNTFFFVSDLVPYQRQHVSFHVLIVFNQNFGIRGPRGPFFLKNPKVIRLAPCGAIRITQLL